MVWYGIGSYLLDFAFRDFGNLGQRGPSVWIGSVLVVDWSLVSQYDGQ